MTLEYLSQDQIDQVSRILYVQERSNSFAYSSTPTQLISSTAMGEEIQAP
jgi:hypothetical protein